MTAAPAVDPALAADDHVLWIGDLHAHCPDKWRVRDDVDDADDAPTRPTPVTGGLFVVDPLSGGTGWPETKGGER